MAMWTPLLILPEALTTGHAAGKQDEDGFARCYYCIGGSPIRPQSGTNFVSTENPALVYACVWCTTGQGAYEDRFSNVTNAGK